MGIFSRQRSVKMEVVDGGGAHSSIKGLPENTHICDSIFSDVRAYLGIAGV